MLFVCHSSLDRENIVKPLLYHLYNYGINIWYDHKKLFLSDTISEDIYLKGIGECSDILIIYSKNLVNKSVCGRGELKEIYRNSSNKNIYPVLYNAKVNDFSGDDLAIIKDTIHFTATENNLHQISTQIAIKLVSRLINKNFDDIKTVGYDDILELYKLIPAFNLREKGLLLLSIIIKEKCNYSDFKDTINIREILNDYISKFHLTYPYTENDVKLLELLTVLIVFNRSNY